ncbi:MAG: hypothetical protein WCF04_03600 [Candidatus Nanopelagicales bacterium]
MRALIWRGLPHAGQDVQKEGSGRAQVAHSGSSAVPAGVGLTCPQDTHRARRRVQAVQHGWLVILEIWHGALRAQIEQVLVVVGRHDGHVGPFGVRTLTRRVRPHPVQVSRLAGSVTRQFAQSGCPSGSRVATSRWAPQREQVTALDLARQLRQSRTPPRGRTSLMTRPQWGHAGAVMTPVPVPVRASISRSTEGTGAHAPFPVSRSGRSWQAQASFVRSLARGVTASTATVIATGSMPGSSPVITSMRIRVAARPSVLVQGWHRGRPARSRLLTIAVAPQAEHRARGAPQPVQNQSCPRRAITFSGFAQPAQTGAWILVSPAARRAISKSPTTRGAGDRPSQRTSGRWFSAAARRRAVLRAGATRVMTARATADDPGSARLTSSTTTPTGSGPAGGLTGRRQGR